MGIWGFNIIDDDTAADVYQAYLTLMRRQITPADALSKLRRDFPDGFDDPQYEAVGWLAVAKAQWEIGSVMPTVMRQVETLEANVAKGPWNDAGPEALRQRQAALAKFLSKLRETNSRPRKIRTRAVKRKAPFQPGDCLAAILDDGEWGAIIVTGSPPAREEPWIETYGFNVIAALNYKSPHRPSLEVFEKRKLQKLTHHNWQNEMNVFKVYGASQKQVKDRLELVAKTRIQPGDPVHSTKLTTWTFVIDQISKQFKWDAENVQS